MASKAKKAAKGAKPKALTKAQTAAEIAGRTGLTKAQVLEVLEAQASLVGSELKAGRPVAIHGLAKFTMAHKAATAARMGRNPFTGAEMMIKAKPARKVVRVRALKALKEIA